MSPGKYFLQSLAHSRCLQRACFPFSLAWPHNSTPTCHLNTIDDLYFSAPVSTCFFKRRGGKKEISFYYSEAIILIYILFSQKANTSRPIKILSLIFYLGHKKPRIILSLKTSFKQTKKRQFILQCIVYSDLKSTRFYKTISSVSYTFPAMMMCQKSIFQKTDTKPLKHQIL